MSEHDLELIAALVEGRLEDESEARALIDSSPELREEYEAQKIAFESLRSLGPVSMTEPERAALHRDVWTGLRQEPERAGRAGAWYHRWVAVAGGALALVGLVAVLGQGVGGQDAGDETFAEIAADLDAGGATTTAAATGDDAGADRAGDETDSPETMADTGTTAAGEAAPMEEDGAATSFYSTEADKVRAGEFSAPLEDYELAGADPEIGSCVTAAGLDDHRVVATLTPPPELDEDGRLAVAIPEDADPMTASVAFVSLDECLVAHVDE